MLALVAAEAATLAALLATIEADLASETVAALLATAAALIADEIFAEAIVAAEAAASLAAFAAEAPLVIVALAELIAALAESAAL